MICEIPHLFCGFLLSGRGASNCLLTPAGLACFIHPPRLWPFGLSTHGQTYVQTQSVYTEVRKALSPMVKHFTATVWFQECSRQQESDGFKSRGGRAVYLENQLSYKGPILNFVIICTDYNTPKCCVKPETKYLISACIIWWMILSTPLLKALNRCVIIYFTILWYHTCNLLYWQVLYIR